VSGSAELPQNPRRKIFILIIEAGDRKLGLIVDTLEGEEELVIKAMDDQIVDTDLITGASILGDGRVVLILNLTAIVDRANQPAVAGDDAGAGLLLLQSERFPHDLSAAGGGR